MGQVLHGSARTAKVVRRAMQLRQESLRALAKRYGINPKTVAKWPNRNSAAGGRIGTRAPKSSVLRLQKRRSSRPFAGTHSCDLITASMHSRRPLRT